MAKLLIMPKLSPTMEEGQLAKWHKKVGDAVAVDDLLAEVETDKATMEFRAFDAGTLLELIVAEGTVVQLGQPVAIIGAPGEDTAPLRAQASSGAAPAATETAPTPPPAPRAAAAPAQPQPVPSPSPAEPGSDERVKASPHVRKLAREQGLELRQVKGSGPGGRIVTRDLAGAPAASVAKPNARGPFTAASLPSGDPIIKPLSMMRKTIARRLTESKATVPHFYLNIDVEVSALVTLREQLIRDTPEGGVRISINDMLVKACALALIDVPECNASFTPDALVFHPSANVSVAVAVPDGLVTPVVRNAERKPLVAIAEEIRHLAGLAKDKKLKPEDMSGGTFSISNLGMYGVDSFQAVINPPEGAILAVGQIRTEPVVRDGELAIGKKLALSLSCDHRVVDGAVGALFLKALRSLLEHPTQLLVR